jgi:hypothetical protein
MKNLFRALYAFYLKVEESPREAALEFLGDEVGPLFDSEE